MQLKDVFIRQGIAFLEPRSVVMKGHKTAERDEDRDKDFVNSLKDRLGVPRDEEPYVPPPQPASPPHMPQQPPAVRSPLRELPPSPPPIAGPSNPTSHTTNSFPNTHDEELPRQRRRKVPSRPTNRTPTPSPPPREHPSQPKHKPPFRSQPRTSQPKGSQNQKLSSSQLQRQLTLSRFFPGGGGSNETSTTGSVKGKGKVAELANELMFSPHRQSAAAMNMDGGGDPDSDEEEAFRSIHMNFSPKPTKEQKPPTFLGSKAKGKEFKVYRDPDPNESNTNNDGDNEPPLPDGYDANMEEDSNSEFGFSFDFDLKEVDKAEKEALGLLSDGSYKGQAETQVGDGPSTTAGRSSRSQTLVGSTAGFDSTGGHSGHDTENSKSSTSRNPPSSSSVSGTGSGSGGSVPLWGPHATEGNGTATNGQSHSEVQPPLGTQAAPIAIDDDDDDLFFSSNTRSGGRAEVISIDDTDNEGEGEEEIDKENVPVMVRRQRRRVLPEGTIIDISED
ncbi:hypothetical protein C8Q75DRAFT_779580 [Abortiporus biennis]|nr:hypothetical protein C8Q75DRAFT_779580 [Abortiporus biennis]